MPQISNTDNTLSGESIQERINELDALVVRNSEGEGETFEGSTEEREELENLNALRGEWIGYYGVSSWENAQFINDDYFEEYAQALAEDIGFVSDSGQWPSNCIDWEKAASALKEDYISIDFDGVDFWTQEY